MCCLRGAHHVRQAEVRDLDVEVGVQEEVLRLQVPAGFFTYVYICIYIYIERERER